MRTPFVRLLVVAVLFVLAASSCSASDSSTIVDQASDDSAADVAEPTATAVPPTATPVPPTVEPAADEPAAAEQAADEPADGPAASASEDTTLIEVMLSSMGVPDVDATVACIVATAEEEGLAPADLMAGTGAPVFVAALRCSDEVAEQMVASSAEFNTAGTDLTIDDVTCVQTTSLDYLRALPLADSEDLFATAAPPDAMVDSIVEACGIDRNDALRVMGA